jgi:hypothetical protein
MDELDFDIPIAAVSASDSLINAQNAFATNVAFIEAMGLPMPEVTPQEKREALSIYHESPTAPIKPTTPGAALMLNKMLAKHDYTLTDPVAKMRNYVMYKFFELAEDQDPKVSMRALENLAKTADIGLFAERVEINIHQKTTVDLESELSTLLKNIASRTIIDGTKASDADYVDA